MGKPDCKIIYQENQFGHVAAGNGTIALLRCPEGYELRWGGEPVWQSWPALSAAPKQKPVAVKVKPLEWVKHPSVNAWRVETAFGMYQVWEAPDGSARLQFDGFDGTRHGGPHANEVFAKAAAQADYESRILPVIEPAPADLREENERLKEAVRRLTTTYANMENGDGEPCPDVAFGLAVLTGGR